MRGRVDGFINAEWNKESDTQFNPLNWIINQHRLINQSTTDFYDSHKNKPNVKTSGLNSTLRLHMRKNQDLITKE